MSDRHVPVTTTSGAYFMGRGVAFLEAAARVEGTPLEAELRLTAEAAFRRMDDAEDVS